MELDSRIQQWLAEYFCTNKKRVNQMLKTQLATSYLLIWPIMEQDLFEGFMKKADIKVAAKKLESQYSKIDKDEIVKHFHFRYQDKGKLKSLKHNGNYPAIDNILDKSYENTTPYERMEFLMYVVYRYRNNIFHGNKGIESWTKYSTEINLCIQFMMNIVDCYTKNPVSTDTEEL